MFSKKIICLVVMPGWYILGTVSVLRVPSQRSQVQIPTRIIIFLIYKLQTNIPKTVEETKGYKILSKAHRPVKQYNRFSSAAVGE